MSRSYKKSPVVTIIYSGMKCKANSRVRKTKEILPKGNYYRRIYNSYDIIDYKHTETERGFKLRMNNIKNKSCCAINTYDFDRIEKEKIHEHDHRDFEKYINYKRWFRFYKRK